MYKRYRSVRFVPRRTLELHSYWKRIRRNEYTGVRRLRGIPTIENPDFASDGRLPDISMGRVFVSLLETWWWRDGEDNTPDCDIAYGSLRGLKMIRGVQATETNVP